MCLISSIYEAQQQKKAAEKARNAAAGTALVSQQQSQSAENVADSEKVKEATTIDADQAAALSATKKSQGVQSTQLNKNLG